MNIQLSFYLLITFVILTGSVAWYVSTTKETPSPIAALVTTEVITPASSTPVTTEKPTQPEPPKKVNLNVPYVSEAPENNWTGSWKNACEEATIAMVEKFYQGVTTVSIAEAKEYLLTMFKFQQEEYGSDANSDAKRTVEIIKNHASFDAHIVENPTIEAIKKELQEGRPIIALHRGFDLKNKNIPFRPTGSSYHTTVLKGYDDDKQVFITNDPGDTKDGHDHLYTYDTLMNSLHDYNYKTQNTDGPARVLFTSPRTDG